MVLTMVATCVGNGAAHRDHLPKNGVDHGDYLPKDGVDHGRIL